jgi:patatin-like phospholipase/acyl hydrolase
VPQARPAAELVGLYREHGPEIFRRPLWQRVTSAEGFIDAKHDPAPLRRVLADYLGAARLADTTTRLLATAYDLEGRAPYFFKSWRVDGEPERDLSLTTVALCTAAAPTYFPPVAVQPPGGRERLTLVDGGVFATNPAMCAYAEATRLAPGEPVTVLSLGTGQPTHQMPFADAEHWGLLEWARPILDVVFDGVADTVDYQLQHLLGDGHTRLQTRLDEASDALDDASETNLRRLQHQGEQLVAERSDELDAVCAALVA